MNDSYPINGIQHCGSCNAELRLIGPWGFNNVIYRDRYSFQCSGCWMMWNGDTVETRNHIEAHGLKLHSAHLMTDQEKRTAQAQEVALFVQKAECELKQIKKVLDEILAENKT